MLPPFWKKHLGPSFWLQPTCAPARRGDLRESVLLQSIGSGAAALVRRQRQLGAERRHSAPCPSLARPLSLEGLCLCSPPTNPAAFFHATPAKLIIVTKLRFEEKTINGGGTCCFARCCPWMGGVERRGLCPVLITLLMGLRLSRLLLAPVESSGGP